MDLTTARRTLRRAADLIDQGEHLAAHTLIQRTAGIVTPREVEEEITPARIRVMRHWKAAQEARQAAAPPRADIGPDGWREPQEGGPDLPGWTRITIAIVGEGTDGDTACLAWEGIVGLTVRIRFGAGGVVEPVRIVGIEQSPSGPDYPVCLRYRHPGAGPTIAIDARRIAAVEVL